MKSKTIFGLFAFAVVTLGLAAFVSQPAQAAKPTKREHVPVTICHATGNPGKFVKMTVDDDSILNEQHAPKGNGHAVHQDGRDIIPPFTTTDGFKYPGNNWDSEGQEIYRNGCVKPGEEPTFTYEIVQRCGYLDVKITSYPVFGDKPYYAVYTTNGSVVLPGQANSFPVTFLEDSGNGSVEVTWYIVGPEKDVIVGSGLPNYWDGIGQTITVDTDCEEEVTEADITSKVACVATDGKSRITLTLTNSGDADGDVVVNGETVSVPTNSDPVVLSYDSGMKVTVVINGETVIDRSFTCGGQGSVIPENPEAPETPETPKTPQVAELPYTGASVTPLVAAGALSLAGIILAVGTAIKSRLLA